MSIKLCRPQTILLPVDSHETSRGAGRYAEAVGRHFDAVIHLLHVLEPYSHPYDRLGEGMWDRRSRKEIAEEQITRFRDQEFNGMKTTVDVAEGDPAQCIVERATSLPAQLIVMPTRSRGRFRRFLVGSTTAKVLDDVSVPVLTGVHMEQAPEPEQMRVQKVLCAIDFDDRGGDTLQSAKLLAARFGSELTVIHASDERAKDKASKRLEEFVARAGVQATLRVTPGDPGKVVCETARECGCDVVVIGRSTPSRLGGRLRTQSYRIIRESPCPVLSV
jgi:nucleotide-binding universal stress UspA family protein